MNFINIANNVPRINSESINRVFNQVSDLDNLTVNLISLINRFLDNPTVD